MTALPTFSARVMALPEPEPEGTLVPFAGAVDQRHRFGYSLRQLSEDRHAAAAIAAEADALAEAARGLRVALAKAVRMVEDLNAPYGSEEVSAVSDAGRAALAAFDKAAGGAA